MKRHHFRDGVVLVVLFGMMTLMLCMCLILTLRVSQSNAGQPSLNKLATAFCLVQAVRFYLSPNWTANPRPATLSDDMSSYSVRKVSTTLSNAAIYNFPSTALDQFGSISYTSGLGTYTITAIGGPGSRPAFDARLVTTYTPGTYAVYQRDSASYDLFSGTTLFADPLTNPSPPSSPGIP